MNPAGRCPACGTQLPARDRQRCSRKPRYCPGACKARAHAGGSGGERLFRPGQQHDSGAL
jgi:hypothetical protein